MAHTHNCHNLLGSLSEYVDGELEAELCAQIEAHLSGCEDCRVVVDTLKKTVYLVHANEQREELPEDVRRRLFRTLNLDEFIEKPHG